MQTNWSHPALPDPAPPLPPHYDPCTGELDLSWSSREIHVYRVVVLGPERVVRPNWKRFCGWVEGVLGLRWN